MASTAMMNATGASGGDERANTERRDHGSLRNGLGIHFKGLEEPAAVSSMGAMEPQGESVWESKASIVSQSRQSLGTPEMSERKGKEDIRGGSDNLQSPQDHSNMPSVETSVKGEAHMSARQHLLTDFETGPDSGVVNGAGTRATESGWRAVNSREGEDKSAPHARIGDPGENEGDEDEDEDEDQDNDETLEMELQVLQRRLVDSEEEKLAMARRVGVAEGEARALLSRANDLEMEVVGLKESLRRVEEDVCKKEESLNMLQLDCTQMQEGMSSAFTELSRGYHLIQKTSRRASGGGTGLGLVELVHAAVSTLEQWAKRDEQWESRIRVVTREMGLEAEGEGEKVG
ncbi:unnamed protein product [Discosporangium mesarthrocarpum]